MDVIKLCSRVVIAVMFLMQSTVILSQNRFELGLFGGTSYYMGDLNPSQQFKNSRPAFGLVGRYIFTDRIALKADAVVAGLKGSYPGSGDIYAAPYDKYHYVVTDEDGTQHTVTKDVEYSFEQNIVDLGAMIELNFMSYDHVFKKETRFTPYVTVGLAATAYKRYSNNEESKPHFVLSLPFGFGAKYKVNKWLRLSLAWTLRKTFTDDLDVTSSTQDNINPSDPYGFGTSKLTHNNDWYSLAGVTVTFSMWPRQVKCSDGMRRFNR